MEIIFAAVAIVIFVCICPWIEKDATDYAKKNPKIPGYPGDYA